MVPGPRSVLLVDDDANFRRALAIALRLDGMDVGEAATAEEARRLLDGGRFTVVLVELLLQDGEAHGLLEHLRLERRDCHAIVCSHHPEPLGAAKERLPGLLLLQKPFRASELRHLVEAHARARRVG
ncbi:MAG TPA: response regulator [Vulgatibacter sp.]